MTVLDRFYCFAKRISLNLKLQWRHAWSIHTLAVLEDNSNITNIAMASLNGNRLCVVYAWAVLEVTSNTMLI